MKVPLKWLKDYLDISLPAVDIANRLTMAGSEVKATQIVGGSWDNILIAQVTAVNPHPNADRLSLVTIDLGGSQETVVSGAPNIKVGDKVAFARVGAQLIDGHTGQPLKLKSAKIRGVVSNGMVCSEKELGISDSHEGILVLPPDAPPGVPLADYLGDAVFDLEVTPNRPDCLSVLGIARELSALTGQALHLPEMEFIGAGSPIDPQIAVEIAAPDLCPRYCASLITGVKIGESPDWMQHRLLACGMRPINNIVDITNYVMLEVGQPLHAFDYSLIKGRKIIVRRASLGEKMATLDGTERTLSEEMLVIADTAGAVAVAGVMGGADTEVMTGTTSVLLEAANFKPTSIHYTAHSLGLSSEASMRFERGIRAELAQIGLKRATRLIVELAGGQAASGIIDVYPAKKETLPISLAFEQVKRLLGTEFTPEEAVQRLASLGFDCKVAGPVVHATVPYWRSDIRLPIDLVEEVARVSGYERIPTTLLSQSIPKQDPAPMVGLKQKVRRYLTAAGCQETVTYSLVSLDSVNRLLPEAHPFEPPPVRLLNPMTADLECLRPTLRANLLQGLAANRRHEDDGVRLFELGRVFVPRTKDLPDEREIACAILSGPRLDKSWHAGDEPMDFFDAKGTVEAFFSHLGLAPSFEKSNDEILHPGKQAAVVLEGKRVGVVGEVHPKVLQAFDITESVFLFEIDLPSLLPFTTSYRFYQPIPRFPPVTRDIALVVDSAVTHQQVVDIIKGFPLVSQVSLFDVYSGKQVLPGKKSFAYRLTFQSSESTLTDEQVDKVQQQILGKLTKEIGATLRA